MFLIDKVKREEKKRFSMLLESNSCIFSRYPFKTLDLWSDIGDYTLQNGGVKLTLHFTPASQIQTTKHHKS
jgi:hypothetical protein